MRSKASIGGHPIHPTLISFPLAFLAGGFVADFLGVLSARPFLWFIGYYLVIAGIGMALLAAVPGLIDYFFTVPPQSSAKARATRHMVVMLSTVALFAISWMLRKASPDAPTTVSLALEAVGAGLLGIGGWLGGTLVTRNLISVDHMYANAGGWNEAYFEESSDPLAVAQANELKINQMKLLHVGARRIVLGRTEDGYVAFDDSCTHRGGSLAAGVLICGTVQCLWHGSQFDVATGKSVAGPAKKAISTYEIKEKDGKIMLTL
ncbi:MAG TPA: DUF2231 domain-containing protein [Gemmatimonadales bacterium]|jgi:nitrite reductase/ring-hydroxylating ferredoxin subunit/uncharacterized membrane protein|nr:DUF2231 domain-containing protein [Gemmatimonadales bacterium]